jgi:FkbM family methyltransferase
MLDISQQDYDTQILSFNTNIYNRFLKTKDIVYDIGAYKGVLSVNFAKMGFDVIAIEGSPINFKILVENTKEYPNIKTINLALHEINQDNIITRFNDCSPVSEHIAQNITYRTLPKIIEENNLPFPKLIKMDIEGMETLALKACVDMIAQHRPIFQLSTHDTYEHGIQCVYDNFPGFKKVSNGGFDFNKFFDMNYLAFDMDMKKKDKIDGFNEYLLIPKEIL